MTLAFFDSGAFMPMGIAIYGILVGMATYLDFFLCRHNYPTCYKQIVNLFENDKIFFR